MKTSAWWQLETGALDTAIALERQRAGMAYGTERVVAVATLLRSFIKETEGTPQPYWDSLLEFRQGFTLTLAAHYAAELHSRRALKLVEARGLRILSGVAGRLERFARGEALRPKVQARLVRLLLMLLRMERDSVRLEREWTPWLSDPEASSLRRLVA